MIKQKVDEVRGRFRVVEEMDLRERDKKEGCEKSVSFILPSTKSLLEYRTISPSHLYAGLIEFLRESIFY